MARTASVRAREAGTARATISPPPIKPKRIAAPCGQRCQIHISQGASPPKYWKASAPNRRAALTPPAKRAGRASDCPAKAWSLLLIDAMGKTIDLSRLLRHGPNAALLSTFYDHCSEIRTASLTFICNPKKISSFQSHKKHPWK